MLHRQMVRSGAIVALFLTACSGESEPEESGDPPEEGTELARSTPEELGIDPYVGQAIEVNAMAPLSIPEHPFLDGGGDSRIHNDHYNSATYARSGPVGPELAITSRELGSPSGVCAELAYLDSGHAVGSCFVAVGGAIEVMLYLFDAKTLEILAEQNLGSRPFIASSAGGAYFSVEKDETILIGPASNRIERYEVVEAGGSFSFEQKLSVEVPELPASEVKEDPMLQDAVLDYDGNIWFTVSDGGVGYYDPEAETFEQGDLGEPLQNSMAVDERGVYILTYEALFRYSRAADGSVQQDWRTAYEAGEEVNGIAPGSGSTPTLHGVEDDLISIGDNRAEQIQLVVMDRDDGSILCEVPLFEKNKSATENTVIGYGDDVVIVNNSGFEGAFAPARSINRGIERYRVLRDADSQVTGCEQVWANTTSFGNSAQLATESGIIWGYGADPSYEDDDLFYVTATSFETGEEVFRTYVGNGKAYDPITGQVHIHPDGTLVIGALYGVISMQDID